MKIKYLSGNLDDQKVQEAGTILSEEYDAVIINGLGGKLANVAGMVHILRLIAKQLPVIIVGEVCSCGCAIALSVDNIYIVKGSWIMTHYYKNGSGDWYYDKECWAYQAATQFMSSKNKAIYTSKMDSITEDFGKLIPIQVPDTIKEVESIEQAIHIHQNLKN